MLLIGDKWNRLGSVPKRVWLLWMAGVALGVVLWVAIDSSVGLLAFTTINFVVVLLLLQFQQTHPPGT